MRLKAGVSIVDISPEKGVELAGYPHHLRNNTGVHDPLFASCIYLNNGKTEVIFVTLDLLFYSKKYVRQLRDKIGKNITFTCSHTHSGPWASGRLDLEALEAGLKCDDKYIQQLQEKLEKLILEAINSTFDAQVGTQTGKCGSEQGVGGNRRSMHGIADSSVNVLAIKDMEGNFRACLVNYTLHPTFLHAESTLVTADYIGYIRRYLSYAKPNMIMLFAQGTSGDQSSRYFRTGQDFDDASRVGTTIGVEVNRCLENIKLTSDVFLSVKGIEVELPLRKFHNKKVAEANVESAIKVLENLKENKASYIDVRNAELDLLGTEDILGYIILNEKGIKPELLIEDFPCEIQVIVINETVIVGMQGEVFVQYGLEIKGKSQFEKTFVFGLTNGALPGYVYTPEALLEGGYEVDTSMFDETAGEIIVNTAISLINACNKKK